MEVEGVRHGGVGELEELHHLEGERYAAIFNIDGCSWAYDGRFDESARRLRLERCLVGEGELAGGVLHGLDLDRSSGRFVVAFSTATKPTQLYVLPETEADPVPRTRERALGLAPGLLAAGEDASFDSHDGLRISARLYLPSQELGFDGERPLVYYVHGGPQGQERPDFRLVLDAADPVPDPERLCGLRPQRARQDRLWPELHEACRPRLGRPRPARSRLRHAAGPSADERVDVGRAGVVGRSYGGYMTLTLAARHPELWRAAVDMFGPYDLLTFMERIPETWKPYFALALGHPKRTTTFWWSARRAPILATSPARCW